MAYVLVAHETDNLVAVADYNLMLFREKPKAALESYILNKDAFKELVTKHNLTSLLPPVKHVNFFNIYSTD